jgi:hypothetical protein
VRTLWEADGYADQTRREGHGRCFVQGAARRERPGGIVSQDRRPRRVPRPGELRRAGPDVGAHVLTASTARPLRGRAGLELTDQRRRSEGSGPPAYVAEPGATTALPGCQSDPVIPDTKDVLSDVKTTSNRT